jgi:acetyl esterase/lipase
MQPNSARAVRNGRFERIISFSTPGPAKIVCLYLNVYTPVTINDNSRLPVMFWIHGGGYTAGAGSEPRYTNSSMPGQDVVLVTINYRVLPQVWCRFLTGHYSEGI